MGLRDGGDAEDLLCKKLHKMTSEEDMAESREMSERRCRWAQIQKVSVSLHCNRTQQCPFFQKYSFSLKSCQNILQWRALNLKPNQNQLLFEPRYSGGKSALKRIQSKMWKIHIIALQLWKPFSHYSNLEFGVFISCKPQSSKC